MTGIVYVPHRDDRLQDYQGIEINRITEYLLDFFYAISCNKGIIDYQYTYYNKIQMWDML